ncbi:MAG: M23 family metallopeptidase [Flavobacteriales bacterium]|jgi:murein DD-endopeptidase MepM/ murein hydrolase activator NlpD
MVANPQPKRKKLLKKLKSRFRLTVLNESTFEEKLSYSLTPLNLIIMFGGMLIVFGTLIYLLVAFTPLKNYVIPDYASTVYREEARIARMQTDSLFEEVRKNERYLTDLKTILSGGTLSNTSDSSQALSSAPSLNYDVSELDETMRQKITEQDRFSIEAVEETEDRKKGLILFKPVNGTIFSAFNPKEGHYGIDLVAPKDDPVKSVLDGTVIAAAFTADDGNIISIQHANNLISVYKHNAVLLRKVGDMVKAGESIAFIGDTGENSEGPHLHFELWENGGPVNPALYLSFGQENVTSY